MLALTCMGVSLAGTVGYLAYKADIGALVRVGVFGQLVATFKNAHLYKGLAGLLLFALGMEMGGAEALGARIEVFVWVALGAAVCARGLRRYHGWVRTYEEPVMNAFDWPKRSYDGSHASRRQMVQDCYMQGAYGIRDY